MSFAHRTIGIFLLCVSPSMLFASDRGAPPCRLDLPRIGKFLDGLKNYRSQPILRSAIEKKGEAALPEDRTPARFPSWLGEELGKFQNLIFGATPLALRPLADYENASFDARTMSVRFGDVFLDELLRVRPVADPKELPRFIVAHEFGHFLQDLSVRANGGKKTLSGLIADEEENSEFNARMEELGALRAARKISEPEYFRRATAFLDQLNCLHAEVDAIGIMVLRRAGYPYPRVMDNWLSESLAQHGPTADHNLTFKSDLDVRLRMSRYFQSIGLK